jgi:Ni/Co efflux regulator RcnB
MNRKIAAVLLAATMLTTPAFAASVASSPNTRTAQTVNPDKVTTTSDRGAKKHRVHARSSHGHTVHHAKHAKPNQFKHAHKISKKSVTSVDTKSHAKTIAAAPAKAQVKN